MYSTPSASVVGYGPALARRRRPRWLLRVAGVSIGGLALGVAIGFLLPGQYP